MNAHGREDPQAWDEIERILSAEPLEPLPSGFHARLMERVQSQPAWPRFRVTWLDLAVSLFAAGMMGLLLLLFELLPSQVVTRLGQEGWYWLQRLRFEPWVAMAAVSALLLAAFALAFLWLIVEKLIQDRG